MKSLILLSFILLYSVSCTDDKIENRDEISPNEPPQIEAADEINKPELTVFKAPDGVAQNETYSVYVRYKGGEWVNLHEYDAGVDGGKGETPSNHMAFVSFDADFSKEIEVKVYKNSGKFSSVQIRPTVSGIEPVLEDEHTVSFTLTKPQKLSLEENGNLHNNLMIFANKQEEKTYSQNSEHVHYFAPGVHLINGDGQGTLTLNSNDTVYIAGGAIVYGNIEAYGAKDIAILGRGILCGDKDLDHGYPHKVGKSLIKIENSKNVKIEGITLLNTVSWNIRLNLNSDVVCQNLKIMGWTINSDGINPVSSSNVLIDDCFMRCYDDCISIKLSYWEAANPSAKDSRNVTVQNCILWTDQGRAIALGPESYSAEEKLFENINIQNVDILYNRNYNIDWAKGALSILLGDDATMRNVLFENIRIDKLGPQTNLITIAMAPTTYSGTPGKRIENITFNNVSLNSYLLIPNIIHGYDKKRMINGVNFQNLKINGEEIAHANPDFFDINSYADNIYFGNISEKNDGPYQGIMAKIPGIIEAEKFDLGGEGVAYHRTNTDNQGDSFRNDAIGIQAVNDDYAVCWNTNGDWLKYSVNVEEDGKYKFSYTVFSDKGSSYSMYLDDKLLAENINVPNTGSNVYQTIEYATPISLAAGNHTLKIVLGDDMNFDKLNFYLVEVLEGPYNGVAATIPGDVEAENFDLGGEGVAFHRANTNYPGVQYRKDAVGIQAANDGYAVSWNTNGDWLKYTVDVQEEGDYLLSYTVCSGTGSSFSLYVNDKLSVENITVPNTGWGTYNTFECKSKIHLTAGSNILKMVLGSNMNFDKFNFRAVEIKNDGPYNGVAAEIPGVIEAENFDLGGEGVAYHRIYTSQQGVPYRDDAIGISSANGGYIVGWNTTGDWLKYTVNIKETGDYKLTYTICSGIGSSFSLEMDGKLIVSDIEVPNTGWGIYKDVKYTPDIYLAAGEHTLKILLKDNMNIDKLSFNK